jgi:hypothetical protein
MSLAQRPLCHRGQQAFLVHFHNDVQRVFTLELLLILEPAAQTRTALAL